MKVYDIRSEQRDGSALVSATVEPANADAVEVWLRIDGVDQAPTSIAEALTVGLLAPCMHDQEALKVYGALSWTLARNLEAAQDVLTAWYPRLTPVDVLASQFTRLWRGIERGTGSACCFTAAGLPNCRRAARRASSSASPRSRWACTYSSRCASISSSISACERHRSHVGIFMSRSAA